MVVREALKVCLLGVCVWDCLLWCLHWTLVCEHLVNVAGVVLVSHSRLVRGGDLTSTQIAPVDVAEERVAHDVRRVR